jgi:outer membrane usher protein
MRRRSGPALGAFALAGCIAGCIWPSGRAVPAETPLPGPGALYAPQATPKSDRLAPSDPASKKTDALPVAATQPQANMETVKGVLLPPLGGANGKTAALVDAEPRANTGVGAPPTAPGEVLSPPPAAARPAHQPQGEAGEILWSNKSAALPSGASSDGSGTAGAIPRTVELGIPVRDGSFYLGDVAARISPQQAVSVSKDRLVQIATPLLRPAALDNLKAMTDSDGYLPLTEVTQKGFDIRYDPGKVELQFAPGLDQRATRKLSAGARSEQVRSETAVQPAKVAGYVNMRAGADYYSQPFQDEEDGLGSARIAFDGAMRWSDIVFESAATFDIEDGFTRGASRLVYDMPDDALRLSAGDITPLRTGLQGGGEMLGVSLEKSYQKLQPGANIRPTGSRSFRIDRPSNVDVMVNGHVMQRLHLRPGDYNLDDLPLTSGANDISLAIEDDVGQKRTLDFTVFSGRSLLAPGISEWSVSAGVASRYGANGLPGLRNFYSELEYDLATPVVTGLYERGLSSDITGNVHLQAESEAIMGGAGAAIQTAFGFWVVDGALSRSATEAVGYAGSVGLELANVKGADGLSRSFRLVTDYRSERFAAAGVPDGYNPTMLDVAAVYSQPLAWDVAGSISGSYGVGRDDNADRFGVDVSLSRNFGPLLSAGFSAGYEQALGALHDGGEEEEFVASLRLSYRVDEKSSIDAGHELRSNRSRVAYRHHEGTGVGSWSAQVEVDRTGALASDDTGGSGDYGVNGSLSYVANRAELAVSQHSGLAGLDTDRLDQRSSVTAGTALAFADGRFAVGRPVSNGFAIVDAHRSLPGQRCGDRRVARFKAGLVRPARPGAGLGHVVLFAVPRRLRCGQSAGRLRSGRGSVRSLPGL